MNSAIDISNQYILKCKNELDQLLDKFVTKVCEGRDESHGRNHMHKISRLSMYIAANEGIGKNELLDDILVVSWLHDVNDHKYNNDDQAKLLDEFLTLNFIEKKHYYMNIIERISYSKEVKYGSTNWIHELGEKGVLIRNIVSDADKIDALGENGIRRCIEFGFHINPNASKEEHIQRVTNHAQEKLLKILDNYIRTETGKRLAKDEHSGMIEILEDLNSFYEKYYG